MKSTVTTWIYIFPSNKQKNNTQWEWNIHYRLEHGREWIEPERKRRSRNKIIELFDGFLNATHFFNWCFRQSLVCNEKNTMKKKNHHTRGNRFHQNNNKLINDWADDTVHLLTASIWLVFPFHTHTHSLTIGFYSKMFGRILIYLFIFVFVFALTHHTIHIHKCMMPANRLRRYKILSLNKYRLCIIRNAFAIGCFRFKSSLVYLT